MATFYLVRHGQTAWNRDERFRGRADTPLSETGFKEAEKVAGTLAEKGVDHIYASPLSRAVQTMGPLAKKLGKDVVPYQDIIDMDFGEWEGLPVTEAEKKYPELFETWKHEPHKVTFPGGESLSQVQARVMRAFSRLAVEFRDSSVAVCSHRVVCKLAMLGMFGAGPEKFWTPRQDTACINHFVYDPPDSIVFTMNHTAHLDDIPGRVVKDF